LTTIAFLNGAGLLVKFYLSDQFLLFLRFIVTTVFVSMSFYILELLFGTNEVVYGIYNASADGDSSQSTNNQTFGQYHALERPNNTCDNNVYTKYLNFGWCQALN